jgi:signal transduction histidine kinase
LPENLSKWARLIRPQDFVWVILFSALIATAETHDISESVLLGGLAVVQILEPKIPALATPRGRLLSIGLKFVLAYLLVGITGGLESRYWIIFLLPVLSAATHFGVVAILLFSLAAGASYLSFALFVDWTLFTVDWPEISELAFRVLILAIVGNIAYILAQNLREQTAQSRLAAEQLATANVQLEEAEEAVRRSDRLAALGQLSAGLAHELRNPMGTIKSSAEMLQRSLPEGNEIASELSGFISTEVDRANSLITRFLQFARPLQVRLDKADLTNTLDRAIAMVQREFPLVAIYKNYAPELAPFAFDAELLERVFYNLVLNAAQATSPGGAITVKTRTAPGAAEVVIIDRGTGIKPEHLNTIFNPFFTTKPEGVGLGLAIVSKIVDEHGGKITVESEPGKGSVFRVYLPTGLASARIFPESGT